MEAAARGEQTLEGVDFESLLTAALVSGSEVAPPGAARKPATAANAGQPRKGEPELLGRQEEVKRARAGPIKGPESVHATHHFLASDPVVIAQVKSP